MTFIEQSSKIKEEQADDTDPGAAGASAGAPGRRGPVPGRGGGRGAPGRGGGRRRAHGPGAGVAAARPAAGARGRRRRELLAHRSAGQHRGRLAATCRNEFQYLKN